VHASVLHRNGVSVDMIALTFNKRGLRLAYNLAADLVLMSRINRESRRGVIIPVFAPWKAKTYTMEIKEVVQAKFR
jgi:hypothetical protein